MRSPVPRIFRVQPLATHIAHTVDAETTATPSRIVIFQNIIEEAVAVVARKKFFRLCDKLVGVEGVDAELRPFGKIGFKGFCAYRFAIHIDLLPLWMSLGRRYIPAD